jgi:hypothetical protein
MAWQLLLGAVRAVLPAAGRAAASASTAARAGASVSSSQIGRTLAMNALGSALGGGGGGGGTGGGGAAPQQSENSSIGQLPPKD